MTIRRAWWVGFVLYACSGSGDARAPATPAPATPAPTPTPTSEVARSEELEVLERVTGGAERNARLPMIVAIHGLGDSPEGFGTLFDRFPARARIMIPRAPEPYYGGSGWFPFDATPAQVRRRTDQLAAAIRRWAAERPTEALPVITGFSQGGILSYSVAVLHPEVVRASFPVAGLLPEPLVPSAPRPGVTYPRVHAMHGDADDLLPVRAGRDAIALLRRRGFPADELEEYPGVPHTIPPSMERALHAHLTAAIAR